MTRMDIKTWRKSANGKAYTIRIGSSWTDKNGVMRLAFDALPIPDEKGQVSCFLEAPREQGAYISNGDPDRMASGGAIGVKGEGRRVDLDDEVPFMMEWR